MSKAPIIRQIAWQAVVSQLALFGLIVTLLIYLAGLPPVQAVMMGALVYLAYVNGARMLVARGHRMGMVRVRRGDFKGAIPYFKRSYAFFSRHPQVDRFRYLLVASGSRITYREMALVNIAYCYGRIGDSSRSQEYYLRALAEYPHSKIANAGVRKLKGGRAPLPTSPAR